MAKEIRQKGLILRTLFAGLKELNDKNLGKKGIEAMKRKML